MKIIVIVQSAQSHLLSAQSTVSTLANKVNDIGKEKPERLLVDSTDFGERIVRELFSLPALVYAVGLRFTLKLITGFFRKEYCKLRQQFNLSIDDGIVSRSVYPSYIYNIIPSSWFPKKTHPVISQDLFYPIEDNSHLLKKNASLPNLLRNAIIRGQTIIHASFGTVIKAVRMLDNTTLVIITQSTAFLQHYQISCEDKVLVFDYIPYSLLLKHSDLFISHGRFNSVISAIMHRVLLLLLLLFAFGHAEMTTIDCHRYRHGEDYIRRPFRKPLW